MKDNPIDRMQVAPGRELVIMPNNHTVIKIVKLKFENCDNDNPIKQESILIEEKKDESETN